MNFFIDCFLPVFTALKILNPETEEIQVYKHSPIKYKDYSNVKEFTTPDKSGKCRCHCYTLIHFGCKCGGK